MIMPKIFLALRLESVNPSSGLSAGGFLAPNPRISDSLEMESCDFSSDRDAMKTARIS
jgi:hypothetical protein